MGVEGVNVVVFCSTKVSGIERESVGIIVALGGQLRDDWKEVGADDVKGPEG